MKNKSTKRENAINFFNELVLSLTKRKKFWTNAERYKFNYVSRFLGT